MEVEKGEKVGGQKRIRVVETNLSDLRGYTLLLGETPLVIGRASDCTIVIPDRRVSQHHARIEATAQGYRVLDTESANGVFVGGRQVKTAELTPGARFRIVETEFEVVEESLGETDDAIDRTLIRGAAPQEFLVRVVSSPIAELQHREFRITGSGAVLGRDQASEIVLDDRSASRRHARLEALPSGEFLLIDLGSANGVWIGERRIQREEIEAGRSFRVGSTVLECRAATEADSERPLTQVVTRPRLGETAVRRLEEAGEAVALVGSQTIVLDDPGVLYYLVAGGVEIFAVALKEGRPIGPRQHYLTIKPGEGFFGIGSAPSQDPAFIATGKAGTVVRRIARDALLQLAAEPEAAEQIARLIDRWVLGLSARLTRDVFPRPDIDVSVEADKPVKLDKGQRAKAAADVVWLPARPGQWLFAGMLPLSPEAERFFFPLTPWIWIEPTDATTEAAEREPRATGRLLAEPDLWTGLAIFYRAVCEYEQVNRRLAIVDEYERLDVKAQQSEAARDAAFDAIGSVLAGRDTEPAPSLASGREPVFEAARLVGEAQGIPVKAPTETRADLTLEEHLATIAGASRFRTRRVALRGEWWLHDNGPLFATRQGDNAPVALLHRGRRGYECVDSAKGTREPVSAELAANLEPFAHVFYRPFPPGELGVRDLLRAGARGLTQDLWTIVAMGVLTGVLGTVTPFLTGQMIDAAIPQGARATLLQIGLGMLMAAAAVLAFKVTQGVAIVRSETRMDYALEAAVWDRLLDLPTPFFREYGAGDLADRAMGLHTIRSMVSQAGLVGILGCLSSVAYLVLMLLYSPSLTLVGVAISLVLVTATTIGNYIQLRHQRQGMALRGGIASLVLQLIGGVGKVRVCAAENHAFRVWAQRFAEQKRIDFSAGQVQNVVQTLGSGYTVLASLVIFAAYFRIQSGPGANAMLSTGSFIAFLSAFGAFAGALQSLSGASLTLLRTVPIYERLKPILTARPETSEASLHPGRIKGEIAVSHLHFRYYADGPWVLKDVSLTIRPGEFVAFVGASGCGKSTLMRLLLGFEKPSMGQIHYDGQDLTSLDLRALRQQLGVVLQESRVLPTDIFRNIVGTTSRTMDEAWEAAEMAGMAEDIRQMPMGMHTVVSEGGGTFSGGQRQRLLIARSLVNRPRILFFDEATSALDNRTQALVTASMDRLDATRLVIAHRLSTIVNAHRIFYLEGGQICEEGTYQELMKRNGRFAELARRQIA